VRGVLPYASDESVSAPRECKRRAISTCFLPNAHAMGGLSIFATVRKWYYRAKFSGDENIHLPFTNGYVGICSSVEEQLYKGHRATSNRKLIIQLLLHCGYVKGRGDRLPLKQLNHLV